MGLFIHEGWDHPQLAEARNDPERLAVVLKSLRRPDGTLNRRDGYERLFRHAHPNLETIEGQKYRLDLATGVVSNADLGWFLAEFTTDSTPLETWTGDFGKSSGGVVTEFTGYTAATRQQCIFTAASGTDTVRAYNPTRASITIGTGISATVYGVCLANSSTKQATTGVLWAATRYDAPVAYAEGQIFLLGYQFVIP
jgi:hypothetical protein